jgi:UDP-3-O-[3-hydroxymyristoyl] glucosamine N-acyltransferase
MLGVCQKLETRKELIMEKTIGEIASLIGGRVIGDSSLVVTGVASVESAGPNDMAFVDSEHHAEKALRSSAGCLIVPETVTSDAKPLIQVKHPKLAFAKVVEIFHPKKRPAPGIHPSAVIADGVTIGEEVTIGPHVVIETGVQIGLRSIIGAGVYIGENCIIGEDCVIYPNVTLYPNTSLGARVIVHAGSVLGSDGFGYVKIDGAYHKFPQIGRLIIEDNVEIGSNVSIDRGTLDATIIKQGTKIDNLVQIAHNVFIGEHCVLAAQVGVAGSSTIEKRAVIGGQVGIGDHVTIGEGAVVGGQAGILTGKHIHPGEFVWGTPARPMSEFKEQYAHIARLPRLKREVEQLKKQVAELEAKLTS